MASSQASLPFTLLLGVLIALTALGMDMFLPSVPVIASELGSVPGSAQLTVTTYLLGLAIGQLGWGPLSDRFGRKPVLLCGLALFLVSAGCGAAAQSIESLSALRFAQGIGMSSGPVVARSIVRDLYAREQAAHLLARMMAVFGVIPVAAPLIGGQAIALGGWRAVFWVFSGIAVALLFAVAANLRETAPAERPSVAPARILRNYGVLFGDARFRAALGTMLMAQMGVIAFVSSSALAVVQALQLSPSGFSVLFAAIMLGQIVGGILGSRLVSRVGISRMVRTGAALAFAGGALLAVMAFAGPAHWAAIVIPLVLYLFGCSFMIPNATAAALAPFPHMAGAASSLLGALPFGLGALVSALLAVAFDGSMRPMALAIGLFGLGAFLAERFLFRTADHG
jgi:DHA1 family bicyclomycin/chloramphenicol resistance-like MFS transporter